MNHLRKARKWNIVFRGLVLALAFVLVACGSGSDDPDPTATTGAEQEAVPTAPTLDTTPESDLNEGDITVLEPEVAATAESSPESDINTAEASASTPAAEVGVDSTASTPAAETTIATAESEDEVDLVGTPGESGEATVTSPEAIGETPTKGDSTPETTTATTSDQEEAAASPTVRPLTGNETHTNPGDGTGGSGMPGESSSGTEDSPVASPSASPVAQFSIEGCEVPDVPNYVGENSSFTLTSDLNFRAGPGVNCDPLLDEPLGEGQAVTVVGGPVVQTEDGSEWVQIEIDGTTGWISTEFIEPTE